jgi:hypothetical protein
MSFTKSGCPGRSGPAASNSPHHAKPVNVNNGLARLNRITVGITGQSRTVRDLPTWLGRGILYLRIANSK